MTYAWADLGISEVAGSRSDPRIVEWHRTARQWTTKWREELMTPAPGTHCGPDDWGLDDSVLENNPES